MSPPQVLIHEFVSGGGWPGPKLPTSLIEAGLAMLEAVLQDFQTWGRVRTLTTVDSQLVGTGLPADQVVVVESRNYTKTLDALLRRCSAALIIAPESGGTLARLSARVTAAGVHLLGSSPEGVAIAGDKWECSRRFTSAGLPTPVTLRVTPASVASAAQDLGYPLVVKPVDGVGCNGVTLAIDDTSLERALSHPACETRDLLLQRYVAGAHASVSLLAARNRVVPLSLNQQCISVDGSFTYHGGIVPFEHPQGEMALELACDAVRLIPGLRGYVGVDLVLSDQGPFLIEVNPRLTTSYVGLRQVIDLNLAQAIWNASLHGRLPGTVIVSGSTSFGKGETCTT